MFDKLFGRTQVQQQPSLTFNERRQRSRSAEPSRRNRDSDIFNRRTNPKDDCFSSEYRKSFAWNLEADRSTQPINNRGAGQSRSNRDAQERPATAISFMQDEVDGRSAAVSRSVTLDQIAASNGAILSLDAQLAAVSHRLSLVEPPIKRSIFGKKSAGKVAFQNEPVVGQAPLTKNSKVTEYKAKFKPFSNYVYLPGNGWLKQKPARPSSSASVPSTDQVDAPEAAADAPNPANCQQWFEEVAERNQKANQYRSRSQFGNPILGTPFVAI
jgi:hypothetical protein